MATATRASLFDSVVASVTFPVAGGRIADVEGLPPLVSADLTAYQDFEATNGLLWLRPQSGVIVPPAYRILFSRSVIGWHLRYTPPSPRIHNALGGSLLPFPLLLIPF